MSVCHVRLLFGKTQEQDNRYLRRVSAVAVVMSWNCQEVAGAHLESFVFPRSIPVSSAVTGGQVEDVCTDVEVREMPWLKFVGIILTAYISPLGHLL